MGPITAFTYCMTRVLKWDARGRRSEFWGFNLVYLIISVSALTFMIAPHLGPLMHLGFVDATAASGAAFYDQALADEQLANIEAATAGPLQIYMIVNLWASLASISASIRRLHDIGRSGWWYLILLVPFVGFLVYLIQMILPSEDRDNMWGPSPYKDPQVKALSEKQLEPYKPPLREIDKHNTTEAIRALRHARTPSY